jgi:hypothetical protein
MMCAQTRECAALQLGCEARDAAAAVGAAAAPQELRFADSRGLVARHAWLPGGRLLVGFSTGGRPSHVRRDLLTRSARSWTPAHTPLRRHQAHVVNNPSSSSPRRGCLPFSLPAPHLCKADAALASLSHHCKRALSF